MKHDTKLRILLITLVCFVGISALSIGLYVSSFKTVQPEPLSQEQKYNLQSVIKKSSPQTTLQQLPYPVIPAELPIQAHAAIVIDTANGCILYEKNADELIPPASLTKLVVMYIALDEIKQGNISLDDIVPLPPESWAKNAPPNSSLMFLGEGQKVSLNELLQGLAVVSGNDAAVAIAHYISGSVDKFVERMNNTVTSLGLVHTSFIESSGYSELNMTTAREFAAFCRIYIRDHPQTLKEYHSLPSFTYPKEHNLKDGLSYDVALQIGSAIEGTLPITQFATNKVLSKIEGADGLKTGFIYESGYNLALTVEKNGTRFLSLTMGGPGIGSLQGNEIRVSDSKIIMNWAYDTFKTLYIQDRIHYDVPVLFGNKNKLTLVELPYYERQHALSAPLLPLFSDGIKQIERVFEINPYIKAPVKSGEVLGFCHYMLSDICLETTALISDRNMKKGNIFKTAIDSIAEIFIEQTSTTEDQLQELYRTPVIK